MLNRRNFIKNTTLAATALSLSSFGEALEELKKVKKIGIQLFSLPKSLDKDFVGTVEMLSKMGYKELELFGPYPFSDTATIENWKRVSSRLGFSGSGYFGKTAQEVKKILDDNGLSSPAAHSDFDTLYKAMDKWGEAAQILGHKYVVLPSIPEDKRKTLDDYKRTAEAFNKIGENAKKVGLKFAYHNHGYGFKPLEGKIPFEVLIEATDSNLVFLEMDIFWTTAAGVNPLDYLQKYANRYKLLHLKDMKEIKTFANDGNTAQEWFALFPLLATLGEGVLDLKSIVKKGQEIGVEHFLVEQDLVVAPEVALKNSFNYMKKLK
jgi:sugar phosphate isomerase/epimerase